MTNWTNAIYLVSYKETKDDDGFSKPSEIKTDPIPARFLSLTRAEEEHSKIMGYNAEMIVEIMKCNYDNQSVLIDCDTNKKYVIKRCYATSSEILQLTCSDISREHN